MNAIIPNFSRSIQPTVPHRVVIVGGGFGGLPATRLLGGRHVDVTLVDRRNHHLFQPLLYQTATGMLSPGQIAPALRHVIRRKKNVCVQLAEVLDIDLERRIVHATAAGRTEVEYPYDSLIVAAGVTQSYFGHDELRTLCPWDEDPRRRARAEEANLRGI